MEQGDKVYTVNRTIETVLKAEEARVITVENPNHWYHPSKVTPIYWSEEIGRWVTIPG